MNVWTGSPIGNLFVREAAEEGLIELAHISTTDQLADIFTILLRVPCSFLHHHQPISITYYSS